ncbi:MAG TPA: glycosyltransferase 87 family protein [Candidatus Deferrimicrobiaceae bacterium]|nr:glycosyltransferase 87 family protein [Candidatus Deferrimicrobiaceae bacterium]
MKRISILAALATLFAVEAALSLYTGLPYDMDVWFKTGDWMNQGINIYQPNDHLGYPPLWSIWCLFSYKAYLFFGSSMEMWRLIIKLPMILAHLFLAYSLGDFVSRHFNAKLGKKLFFITLGWVFIIYIAAMWGQINTISALLTFLAFDAIINKKISKSGILLGIAVALKIYPLILAPAFLAYAWMQTGKKSALKFSALLAAIPIAVTATIFAVYRWDIFYFLKTIFYWTPVFETSQPQISGGCMNLWSFTGLFNVDVGTLWFLRLLWIPIVLGGFAVYFFRRRRWDKMDFNLALITLFILFLASYGYTTEQSFVDLLPFLFLQVLCFKPRRTDFLLLIGLQVLVFAFSAVNYGEFIFQPFIEEFYPSVLASMQVFVPTEGSMIWAVRGILGLAFTVYALGFLFRLIRHSKATAQGLSDPKNSRRRLPK